MKIFFYIGLFAAIILAYSSADAASFFWRKLPELVLETCTFESVECDGGLCITFTSFPGNQLKKVALRLGMSLGDQEISKEQIVKIVISGLKNIEKIEPEAFVGFPMLKVLEITGCSIREISPEAFVELRQVEMINLAENKIVEFPEELWVGWSCLKVIDLRGNEGMCISLNAFIEKQRGECKIILDAG